MSDLANALADVERELDSLQHTMDTCTEYRIPIPLHVSNSLRILSDRYIELSSLNPSDTLPPYARNLF